jgi:uncharacterized damage-inducible protein DinB
MTIKDTLVKSLKDGHALFLRSLSDFPVDKLTYQTSPTENHVLWTAGHMVTTYAWWATFLTKDLSPIPPAFAVAFDNKKKPVADSAAYPAMSEVLAELDRQYQIYIKAVEALPESEYYNAPLVDSGGFVTYKVDVLVGQINHIGWHTGQISSIRRALSLPSLYGMY